MLQGVPQSIEEIPCYAPQLAYTHADFPSHGFETLFNTQDRNFWYRSRNRIIKHSVGRYLGQRPAKFLEIGCGTGYVLKGLSQLPQLTLTGADVHLSGLRLARKQLPGIDLIQLDVTDKLPVSGYDGIGAFDVLEHIEQDERVLAHMHHALVDGGYAFMTVPQHPFLWSATDEHVRHKRRYTRRELLEKLKNAGFSIRFISSYVFTLFPFLLLARLRKSDKSARAQWESELQITGFLDRFLEVGMLGDEVLIKAGVSLPFGCSLLVVAQKK